MHSLAVQALAHSQYNPWATVTRTWRSHVTEMPHPLIEFELGLMLLFDLVHFRVHTSGKNSDEKFTVRRRGLYPPHTI